MALVAGQIANIEMLDSTFELVEEEVAEDKDTVAAVGDGF